jgi:hypothetical protein
MLAALHSATVMGQTKAQLIKRIHELETELEEKDKIIERIQVYEQHHQSCHVSTLPATPTSTEYLDLALTREKPLTSVVPTDDVTPNNQDPSSDSHGSDTASSSVATLPLIDEASIESFVSVEGESVGGSSHVNGVGSVDSGGRELKRRERITRWKKAALSFINNVPTADQWEDSRKKLSLDSRSNYKKIIAVTAGEVVSTPHPPKPNSAAHVTTGAKAYATLTQFNEANAKYTQCVASFQTFIFISLCAVLDYCEH